MAMAGAGLFGVLQNLQSKLSSLLLDELKPPRFGEKERQTSLVPWLELRGRAAFGEREKQTSLVLDELESPRLEHELPRFGEKEKQTSLVPRLERRERLDLQRLGEKEKQTSLVVDELESELPGLPRFGEKEKRLELPPELPRLKELRSFGEKEKQTSLGRLGEKEKQTSLVELESELPALPRFGEKEKRLELPPELPRSRFKSRLSSLRTKGKQVLDELRRIKEKRLELPPELPRVPRVSLKLLCPPDKEKRFELPPELPRLELEPPCFGEKEKQMSPFLDALQHGVVPRVDLHRVELLPELSRLELEPPRFGEKEKQTSLVLKSRQKEKRTAFGKKEEQTLESCLSEIAAVLQDAERRKHEIAVWDWLRKLEDAVYDAEERIDKIVVEALALKAQKRYISPYITPLSFRFKGEMQELMIRFRLITEEMNDFHFKEGFVETQPPISITRQTSSWSYVIESEVYTRDCEKQELIDPLINFENKEEVPSVLPVVDVGVGRGVIGKTTLARLVFHDERIIAHFDLRMWVSVTEADSDVPSLVKKILESAVGAYVYHPSSSSSDLVLQTQLQEKLHEKRYLLVLDGVRNEERYKWNRLKACLKCGAMGSRILVTTRSDTVASIMGTLPRHDLGTLSEEQSWSLFQKLAKPLPDFLSIGKEMVDRCGGDALAVKTLGGLMFTKTTKEEWESVRSSDFWKPQDNDGGILPVLRVGYDHLTSSLKQCFVYCAVFPKGCEIDKNKLIKQWIAHGFIHSDGKNELLEEEGECYFSDLLRRSLFQVKMEANGIDVKLYKMHDRIHDFLIYLARNEYFTDEASMEIDCREARHLVLQNRTWVGQPKNLDTLNNCSRIRSMFLCFPAFIDVCLSLRGLRVLDLSFAQIESLPAEIDKLKHLRYLDVSSKWLTKLPKTMCNLHCLQTLICLGSPLQTLPKEMRRMISLRHIEFDVAKDIHLPSGIGELTCLRTLPKFVVGKRSGRGIEELKCLNKLSGDIRIEGLDNISDGVCAREANLKGKQHLHSLELSWPSVEAVAGTRRKAEEVIENLEPHSNLKKLVVENYPGPSLPSWMMMLSNLVDIKLSHCNGCEHLPPLGQLCFLETLKIEEMSAVKYIVEFDGSHNYKGIFPSLKELYLCDMPNLEGWSSLEEDVHGDGGGIERDEHLIHRHLRHLTIYNCPNMIQLPQLHLLTALECLKMNGVGCATIELPLSQSLNEVALSNMCNLERCLVQETNGKDNNDQVIFRSLHTLSISNCPQLICLPWLHLPALEYLMMSRVGCEKIDFCTSSLLKSVSLANMPDLEQWSPQKANDDEQAIFPRLKLEVQACPRMVCLPNFLLSVKEMTIYQTNELLLKSVANFTPLAFLSISGISEVTYLPKELGPNHASLRILEISDCPKLMSLSYQLKNLPALKELTIEGCSDLVLSLSDELQEQQQCPPLSTLEVLKIVNSCEKQASLPGNGIVLTSLRELNIRSCGNLESLSSDGLQNLNTLTIFDCPRVWSSPEWLGKLRSLSNLRASRCTHMTNLPDSIGNLTSLSKLWIEDWPALRSLPESLGNLKLLKIFTIANCPQVICFPEGMQHLENLRELFIDRCPNLMRRLCENERMGEDWPKIARVPNICIDGLNIRDYLSREESSGASEEEVDQSGGESEEEVDQSGGESEEVDQSGGESKVDQSGGESEEEVDQSGGESEEEVDQRWGLFGCKRFITKLLCRSYSSSSPP